MSRSRSALISITQQVAQRRCGFAPSDVFQDRLTGFSCHDEFRVHHDIRGQFLQRPEVVPKRLFHQVALLDTSRTDMSLEQVAGRSGDDC